MNCPHCTTPLVSERIDASKDELWLHCCGLIIVRKPEADDPANHKPPKGKRPMNQTRSCDECHKPYHPISGNQKYCSPCSMVVLKRQRRASSVRWKERKKG
jgi:hypothetical protein